MQERVKGAKFDVIGTRPIRHDGLDKVIGKARFAADLNLTGQLRAVMVRSPHAHARILSIDTSAAEPMPGVKAVVTGADFPALHQEVHGRPLVYLDNAATTQKPRQVIDAVPALICASSGARRA